MGIEKVYLSWDDVYELLDKIHEQVKNLGFTHVTGIPRGGLILAVLYSHRYGVPFELKPEDQIYCLVLDDIADSGTTLQGWRKQYYSVSFATLHYKEISSFEPNYYGEKIDLNYGWIVYPWENTNANPLQDYLEN